MDAGWSITILAALTILFCSRASAQDVILYDYLSVQEGVTDQASPLDPSDGEMEPKVANGDTADWKTEFRSLVRIDYNTSRGPSRCTGVLLAEDIVLTAGHCSCGSDFSFFVSNGHLNPPTIKMELKGDVRLYPGFSCLAPLDTQPARDLALMRLSGIIPGRAPRIVHMLDLRMRISVSNLAVAGFGRDENGVVQETPRIGQVPVFSFFCSSGMAALSRCRPFREFALAVDPDGSEQVDTCDGDSGGPVFAFRRKIMIKPDGQERVALENMLVGITSRGMAGVRNIPGLNCGGGGIYTSVGNSDVLSWLLREGVPVRLVRQIELVAEN